MDELQEEMIISTLPSSQLINNWKICALIDFWLSSWEFWSHQHFISPSYWCSRRETL